MLERMCDMCVRREVTLSATLTCRDLLCAHYSSSSQNFVVDSVGDCPMIAIIDKSLLCVTPEGSQDLDVHGSQLPAVRDMSHILTCETRARSYHDVDNVSRWRSLLLLRFISGILF